MSLITFSIFMLAPITVILPEPFSIRASKMNG
jgi:hypothetical protein